MSETCFNYCDKQQAFFSSDEEKWIRQIHKLKEAYPDQVTILAEPETNDGCIYCKLPASTLKIKFPKAYSEEQRKKMAANLAKVRLVQKPNETNE